MAKQPWEMTVAEWEMHKRSTNDGDRWNRVFTDRNEYRLPNLPALLGRIAPHRLTKDIVAAARKKTVKVYRGQELRYDGLVPGNWVALRRSYASATVRGRSEGHKVIEQEVPAEDIVMASTDESEFFYLPVIFQRYKGVDTTHEGLVWYALDNGLAVPDAVLADYPALAARYGRSA